MEHIALAKKTFILPNFLENTGLPLGLVHLINQIDQEKALEYARKNPTFEMIKEWHVKVEGDEGKGLERLIYNGVVDIIHYCLMSSPETDPQYQEWIAHAKTYAEDPAVFEQSLGFCKMLLAQESLTIDMPPELKKGLQAIAMKSWTELGISKTDMLMQSAEMITRAIMVGILEANGVRPISLSEERILQRASMMLTEKTSPTSIMLTIQQAKRNILLTLNLAKEIIDPEEYQDLRSQSGIIEIDNLISHVREWMDRL